MKDPALKQALKGLKSAYKQQLKDNKLVDRDDLKTSYKALKSGFKVICVNKITTSVLISLGFKYDFLYVDRDGRLGFMFYPAIKKSPSIRN